MGDPCELHGRTIASARWHGKGSRLPAGGWAGIGTKQTCAMSDPMSAFGGKADLAQRRPNVS
jgi:hypothetical protein